MTSPFIKFKNASKETIDASEELVEEIRRALMQAGQKLSRHIKREDRAADLERKLAHIEKFGPILVEGLARIVSAGVQRKKKAEEGLKKLLGRDSAAAEGALQEAEQRLSEHKEKQKAKLGFNSDTLASKEKKALKTEVNDPQKALKKTEGVSQKIKSKKASSQKAKKKSAKRVTSSVAQKSVKKKASKTSQKKRTKKTSKKKKR